MRIALLTRHYPPANTEGIPRQRQALGRALAAAGHEVHVLTLGRPGVERDDAGVAVHEVAPPRRAPGGQPPAFFPAVDEILSGSEALYRGLAALHARAPLDVADAPLWSSPGLVAADRLPVPLVVWLQTTSLQIARINRQRPTCAQRQVIGLERRCLERAAGILSDSGAALDSIRADYGLAPRAPAGIAHLGLPPRPGPLPVRAARDTVEALVVGRLEPRKGTPMLLDLLPDLLGREPRLRVRFVGADNRSGGGPARRGGSYAGRFRRRHPGLEARVLFDGYLDDDLLPERYAHADLLLVPSLYESFGLIYLEAMRAGLPVVTFAAGGAAEVFARGEDDGALLVPPGDARGFAAAVRRLAGDPALRARLGTSGARRFAGAFTDAHMARETARFYAEVCAARRTRPPARPRVVCQVMDSLDVGDAVSTITGTNADRLARMGQPEEIYACHVHREVRRPTRRVRELDGRADTAMIFHYWNFNPSAWLLGAVPGPKAVHFHNITPPEFFPGGHPQRAIAATGLAQLAAIADRFDLVVGDSRFNLLEYAQRLHAPRPGLVLYPVLDADAIRAAPHEKGLEARLRGEGGPNVLFVGRVARNKRHELLLRAFDRFCAGGHPRARLWLVGDDRQDPPYRAELEALRRALPSAPRIRFAGKIPDAAVRAYYRAADVFLCASAHEGFCLPLMEAAAHDLPAIAFASSAVPETLGESGVLVREWSDGLVAGLLDALAGDARLRERVVEGQRANLARFGEAQAERGLRAIVDFLLEGRPSPLFETLAPGAAP